MKTKLYIIIPIILFISLIPNVIGVIAEEPSEEECSIYAGEGHDACVQLKVPPEDCRKYYYFDGADNSWKMCQPNPYDISLSSCYYSSEKCDPKIIKEVKIEFDEDYIKNTELDRLFTPKKPITPFDDIIFVAKVKIPPAMQFPFSLLGRLTTYDKATSRKVVLAERILIRVPARNKKEKEEEGKHIYTYESGKIIGWPDGWTDDNERMEALVQNGEVIYEVRYDYMESGEGKTIKKTKEEKISLCVHLWGPDGSIKNDDGTLKYPPADFKIVNMRGGNAGYSPKDIKEKGEYVMENGYYSIKPFSEHKEKFAHYADLKKYGDPGTIRDYASFSREFPEKSECSDGKLYNFYTDRVLGSTYRYGNKGIVLLSSSWWPSGASTNIATLAIHGAGKVFCKLDHENLIGKTPSKKRNCRKYGTEFWPDRYGRKWAGCSESRFFLGIGRYISATAGFYRPSPISIMRWPLFEPKFNVVGYGYCLLAINNNKGNIVNYWAAGLGKEGVIQPDSKRCKYKDDCAKDGSLDCMDCLNNECKIVNNGKPCLVCPTWPSEVFPTLGEKQEKGVCERGYCVVK